MGKKRIRRGSRPIVAGHLEKISSKVFDRYRRQITDMIRGNYGVYALYRRDKLYYIGLATDFRRRINQISGEKIVRSRGSQMAPPTGGGVNRRGHRWQVMAPATGDG